MFSPWFPPRLNLTGTALPAFTPFTTGRLSTGWKNPLKLSLPPPHAPAVHVVATVQKLPSSHAVPVGSLLATHDPEPLQVSGLSQFVSLALPHGVVADLKPLSWHPPTPSQ